MFFGSCHFLLEFFYTTLGVDIFGFAGEEGVAVGADLNVNGFLSRASSEGVVTGTGDFGVGVKFWVNVLLHRGYFNIDGRLRLGGVGIENR